jgi:hypothetical protein
MASAIYARLLLNHLHKNKISSFINLLCHVKKQMNHRSIWEELKLGNYVAKTDLLSCLVFRKLHYCFHNLYCSIQFHMFNLVCYQFLEVAVASFLGVLSHLTIQPAWSLTHLNATCNIVLLSINPITVNLRRQCTEWC